MLCGVFLIHLGKTIAQVALKWLLEKRVVSSVIIGVKSVEQLEENLGGAIGWQLTPEDVSMLQRSVLGSLGSTE